MELSDTQKTIILVLIVGIVIYFFVIHRSEEKKAVTSESKKEGMESVESTTETPLTQEEAEQVRKFMSRNASKSGEFVTSTYAEGSRDNKDLSNLDKYFEDCHAVNDDTTLYAKYTSEGSDQGGDKFDAGSLLPKETNSEWFDDPYESSTVKNTHLINIHRPIGVNTIQTSLKNANRQLRAEPINPRIANVSPFLNSSYEPDMNIRGDPMCVQ